MLNPDGSDNDDFHCIQADGIAAQASEELSRGMALLTQDEDDNDPFVVDCEDDEELETNETLTDDDTD